MENGAFAPKEQMLQFPFIFEHMIFQRYLKALLWSKRLKGIRYVVSMIRSTMYGSDSKVCL